MEPLRQFVSAAEMRGFYRGLRARIKALGPPPPPPPPEPEPPPPPLPPPPPAEEPEPQGGPLNERQIIRAVCVYFGIHQSLLAALRRDRLITRPRHICMFLLRERLGLSLPQIGRLLGGFDHTSVLHGCRRIAAQRVTDLELDADVRNIEARLGLLKEKQQ